MEPEPFSKWLRRNNMLPPDFDLPEFDEENIRKEYDEANANKVEEISDHQDDKTNFEICVINKDNKGLIINAGVNQGEITLGKVLCLNEDALKISRMGQFDR